MRVYVLEEWTTHEDMEILGVFVSPADALQHAEAGKRLDWSMGEGEMRARTDRADLVITAHNVKGAP